MTEERTDVHFTPMIRLGRGEGEEEEGEESSVIDFFFFFFDGAKISGVVKDVVPAPLD